MTEVASIELRGVTMRYPVQRRYRDYILRPFRREMITALSNAALRIRPGESVAVLGENGAGKTTLLKLMGGMLYPTEGNVTINGLDTVCDADAARRAVSYVLNEERSFYWRLTGRQNLRFFGALDDLCAAALEARIEELLRLVGLVGSGDRRVGAYSSGMRQRLALARGLLSDPDILILDEPTRAIDPLGADELRALILDELFRTRHKTLLIATHQLAEAELLCERVCVVSHGRILADEDKARILQHHGSVADFYRARIAAAEARPAAGVKIVV